MDDLFRSFFGFHRNRRGPSFPENPGFPIDESSPEDEQSEEDHGPESFNFQSPDGAFSFSFNFPDNGQMFQHFDEMFRNIGLSEFPSLPPGHPNLPAPQEPNSPRDEMLKKPDKENPANPFGQPWELPAWGRSRPYRKQDSDLDKEVAEKGIESFLSERKSTGKVDRFPAAKPGFNYRSISVRTIRKPDGRVEEHRMVDNGSGRETTVKRILGDKSHSVTTKTDRDGKQEKLENFSGLNDKEIDKFEDDWQKDEGNRDPRNELVLGGDPVDQQTQSIFKNIFGFSFPGFGKS